MTDTHVRKYQEIIDNIIAKGDWNTWGEDVDPMDDLEIFNQMKEILYELFEEPNLYEGIQYFEEHHIYQG